MIKVYHAPLTRSLRVIWALEELGLPYEVVKLDRTAGDLQKPAYLAVNPLGKVPSIEDGATRMFESGAIVEYLVERYGGGRLAPAPGSPNRAAYLQWMHWSEASAMPWLSMYLQHGLIKPEAERVPAIVAEAEPVVDKWLAMLDRHLADRSYILGAEFSAADIMLGYSIAAAQFASKVDDRFPNVLAYQGRLSDRPGFKKAAKT